MMPFSYKTNTTTKAMSGGFAPTTQRQQTTMNNVPSKRLKENEHSPVVQSKREVIPPQAPRKPPKERNHFKTIMMKELQQGHDPSLKIIVNPNQKSIITISNINDISLILDMLPNLNNILVELIGSLTIAPVSQVTTCLCEKHFYINGIQQRVQVNSWLEKTPPIAAYLKYRIVGHVKHVASSNVDNTIIQAYSIRRIKQGEEAALKAISNAAISFLQEQVEH